MLSLYGKGRTITKPSSSLKRSKTKNLVPEAIIMPPAFETLGSNSIRTLISKSPFIGILTTFAVPSSMRVPLPANKVSFPSSEIRTMFAAEEPGDEPHTGLSLFLSFGSAKVIRPESAGFGVGEGTVVFVGAAVDVGAREVGVGGNGVLSGVGVGWLVRPIGAEMSVLVLLGVAVL